MPSSLVDQLLSGLLYSSSQVTDFAQICFKSASLQMAFQRVQMDRRKREKEKRDSAIEMEVQRRQEAAKALAATKIRSTSSKVDVTSVKSSATISAMQIEDEVRNQSNQKEQPESAQIKFDLSYDLSRNSDSINRLCKRARGLIYELRATRYTYPEREIMITTDTQSKYKTFKNKVKSLYDLEKSEDYNIPELRPILLQIKQLEGDFDLLMCELSNVKRVKNTFNIAPVTSDILTSLNNIMGSLTQLVNNVARIESSAQAELAEQEAELIKYEIIIYTGTEGLSGTEIENYPILLKLYSDSNESNFMNICETSANLPAASQMNVYVFYCPDVGPLRTVGIFHRDKRFQSWDLRNIEIVDEKRGNVSFPVLATVKGDDEQNLEIYVAKNKGIVKERPTLKVSKAQGDRSKDNSTYGVEIKTQRGKLTFVNKLTTLFRGGTKTIGGLIEFTDGQQHFTPNSKDVYKARWPVLHNIDYMEISVRGPLDETWFCESVTLTDFINDKTYFFPVNGPVDLERIRIRAQNTRKPGITSYQVKVKTGGKSTLGFEGPSIPKVYLQLASDAQVSDQFELAAAGSGSKKKLFQRDGLDIFQFNNVKSVGEVQAAKLWHNGTEADAWFCDSIVVIDLDTSQTYTFPVNRWLGDKKQDGLKSLDLQIGTYPDDSTSKTQYIPDEKKSKTIRDNLGKLSSGYVVTVKTGESGFFGKTGTDSPVTLTIKGDKRHKFELVSSKNNKDPFEKGNIDAFVFEDVKSIGEIKSAVLQINPNSKDGWFCDYVHVEDVSNKETYKFPVNRWLDKKQYDKKTTLNLTVDKEPGYKGKGSRSPTPSGASTKSQPGSDTGKSATDQTSKGLVIKVKTGEKNALKFAGTDNDVFVRFMNDKKSTDEIVLKDSTTNKNPFEAGRTDQFVISNARSIGNIERAVLKLKAKASDAWFCENISVLDVKGKKTYDFPVNRWLDNKNYDQLYIVNLQVNKEPGYLPYGKDISKYDAQNTDTDMTYYIRIKTKSLESKDKEVPKVFINIIGSKSSADGIYLSKSDQETPFQKGQLDSFVAYAPDIGELKSMELMFNGGYEDRWTVDYVEYSVDTKKWKKMSVKKPLDAKSPHGHCMVVLK